MSDLRRFPVSDEFSVHTQTLDFDSNRMNFFEFSSSHFSRKWKLFGQSMEMSGMALRIDWKCSRVSAGPPSGRKRRVKCGMDIFSAFRGVSGNLENGGCPKNCYQSGANFFWADGTGPGSVGGLAGALSSKRSKSRAKSTRVAYFPSWISHFRPCSFWTVGTPGLPRATGNDGPG